MGPQTTRNYRTTMRHVLKYLLPAVVLGVVLTPGLEVAEAQTRAGGQIKKDTRFTKDKSPYVVYEDIHVLPGATLTIDPGVVLQFKEKIKDDAGVNRTLLELHVEGRLVAVGAHQDSIRFTSAALDPDSRDWNGILINDGGSVHLENVIIDAALTGVSIGRSEDAVLKNVAIFNCYSKGVNIAFGKAYLEEIFLTGIANRFGSGAGISLGEGAEAEIFHCFVVGAQNGVVLYGGSKATIRNTVISNCIKYAVNSKASDIDISYSSITANEYGIVLTSLGSATVHHNNIFENGVADVWLKNFQDDVTLDFSNNWWQKKSLTDIQSGVLDGTRDATTKGFVLVEPVLEMAVTTDPNVK